MKVQSLPRRIISGFAAAALSLTMCPFAAQTAFAVDGEAAAEGISDEMSEDLVSTQAAEPAATQISVSAPMAVIFGNETPYDVNNPQSYIISDTVAKFANGGTSSLYLTNIECSTKGSQNVLEKTSEFEVADQKILSMVVGEDFGTDDGAHFGFGTNNSTLAFNTDVEKNGYEYFIGENQELPFRFRLNLTNKVEGKTNSVRVNPNVADDGKSVQYFAQMKYTFASPDFALQDISQRESGKAYSLTQVKAQAKELAVSGDNWASTDTGQMYASYLEYGGDDNYTCETKWNGYSYSLRILGVNHDEVTNPTAYGATKAGITFQFTDSLQPIDTYLGAMYKNYANGGARFNNGMPLMTGIKDTISPDPDAISYERDLASLQSNQGGWAKSELRARMNPGTTADEDLNKIERSVSSLPAASQTALTEASLNPWYNGEDPLVFQSHDDNAIWNLVPASLQDQLVSVQKYTHTRNRYNWETGSNDTLTSLGQLTASATSDTVFTLSAYEIMGDLVTGTGNNDGAKAYSAYKLQEGSQYQYYKERISNASPSAINSTTSTWYKAWTDDSLKIGAFNHSYGPGSANSSLRTMHPEVAYDMLIINLKTGTLGNSGISTSSSATILPCFCL